MNRYDLHGVRIDVRAADPAVEDAIDARLRHFRTTTDHHADVVFELGGPALERPGGTGRTVYDPPDGEVLYFAEPDVLWIDHRGVRVHCAADEARIRSHEATDDVWLRSRPLFTLPLAEVLKRRGLYSLHAAGVARDGRALLLPGTSGAGKSTLTVALARAGFGVLSDDMVFVRGAEVLGFPDEADVSDATASWFPELAGLAQQDRAGWPKHRVRLEDVYGAPVATSAQAAAIVFPAIADVGESRLEPLSPDEALVALAPNVLLTETASAQRHLDALGALVRSTPCHRLIAGHDFDRIVALLGAAIAPG